VVHGLGEARKNCRCSLFCMSMGVVWHDMSVTWSFEMQAHGGGAACVHAVDVVVPRRADTAVYMYLGQNVTDHSWCTRGGEVTPYSQVRALHYGIDAAGAWWVQGAGFAAGHIRRAIRSATSITIAYLWLSKPFIWIVCC
jgi:hypothetical protein